jgi:MFS family permease
MPGLFRKRGFTGGLLVGLAFFATLSGFSLIFSLYVQIGLHYSPLKAGLSGIPLSFGMVLGFGAAQPLLKLGRTLIQGGALITCAGVGGMILTMHLAGPGVTPWQFIPALAVTGFGMSLVMGPFFDTVLSTVDRNETGSASGTLNAVQQLGSSLGVALLGTVFFDVLPHHGMQDAMRTTLWVVIALALAAAALNFLLPRGTAAAQAPGQAPDSTPVASNSR